MKTPKPLNPVSWCGRYTSRQRIRRARFWADYDARHGIIQIRLVALKLNRVTMLEVDMEEIASHPDGERKAMSDVIRHLRQHERYVTTS